MRVREGRTALVITILLIATLTIPAIAFGTGAGAQSQQSPTPTGTAPAIQLLNPSDYSAKPVISDKDNNPNASSPDDTKYHFNAWTRNAPSNATVEFFIVQGQNTISLGPATNRGNGIYDVFSEIPDSLNDADATVRVILFSGGELARDEQLVSINQKTDDPDEEAVLNQGERRQDRAAETVEIRYPQNGGGVGFFGRPGPRPAANIEVSHSRTGTAGSGIMQAGGPERIRVFYTTSFRGTDPEWKECGTETQSDSSGGVRCMLVEGDIPENVTGIAAVTRDEETPPDRPGNVNAAEADNAGDAHAASGYTQVPTSVNVGSVNSPTGQCTPLIPVLVNDQIGRKIVGAPVDVHAQGPGDNLAFNTESTEQSQTNASNPDRTDQPENHSTEAGRQCDDNTLSQQLQGEHEEAGALPDRKHIESTDGTDDNGQFHYRMWNDTPGGTAMTAFIDMDENDRFCAQEASGNGVINWGSGGPAAPVPGGPEEQTCANTPAPTGSTSSGSASASSASSSSTSPSQTASTTASQSGSPSTTASSSTTGSPSTTSGSPSTTGSTTSGTGTGTAPSSPAQATREISIEASKARLTFGKPFTLSGTVESTNPTCTDFVNVQIMRDVVGGSDEFELYAQEQTDGNGAFSLSADADRSATYVAQVLETAACDDASSNPQPVLVRVKVGLRLSDSTVDSGDRVRFRITTAPCPATARDKVLLFRAIQGEFGKSGRARTNGKCAATIVRRVNASGVYQARWPKQSPQFLAGKSRSKAVRVTE